MSPKKTIILAVVLALASTYLYKVAIPGRQEAATTKPAFAKLEPAAVESVFVTVQGSPSFEMLSREVAAEKQADEEGEQKPSVEWRVSQLPGAPLDASETSSFVSALLGLAITGPIDEKSQSRDFSAFGLDKPALTLVVRRKGGDETEVAFGKLNEFLAARYVKVSGRGGIFMVPQESFAALNKNSKELRSKNPLEMKSEDVRELWVSSPAGAVKLVQPAVGEWRIVEPKDLPASSESVGILLEAIGAVTVDEFLDGKQGSLGEYRLASPEVRVDVALRPGLEVQKRTISVASSDEGKKGFFTYSDAPSVFSTAANHVPFLSKGVDDLRENKLFTFSHSDIHSVRSTTGDGSPPVEIVASRTDWDVNGKVSDPMFVEEILKDIAALKATGFPEPTSVPADAFKSPFVTLVIVKKGDAKETVTLFVGSETPGKDGPARYAKVGEAGPVVLIPDIEAKRIVPHEEALLPGKAAPTIPPFPQGGSLSSEGKDS